MRPALLFAVAAVLHSCACVDDGGGGTGGGGEGGGEGGGGGSFPNPLDAGIHYACSSRRTFDEPMLDEVFAASERPLPDGTSEVAISTDPCFRVVRTQTAGALGRLALVRYSGQADFKIENGTIVFFEKPDLPVFDLRWSPNFTMKVDSNLDGFAENEASETYDAMGLVQQQEIRYSPSTRAVDYRSTLSRVSASLMHQKVERVVSGTLTTVRDHDVPAVQKQSGGCMFQPPQAGGDACADVAALRAQLKSVLDRGIKCMLNASVDDVARLLQLRAALATIDITCFRDTSTAAQVDISRPGGRIPLQVNTDLGTCSVAYQDGSLFHELMHLIHGGHDSNLEALLESPGSNVQNEQYAYMDRMRSCERLCFGTLKTKCACASCLETKACDERCDQYSSCIVREPNPDGGTPIAVMSEAVGAICQSNANPSMGAVFRTMAACMSACGAGSSCRSKSLSCDTSCK